ncbi:FecR family protein [Zobellia amurskyensis]|uniref:FecR family protein n=1 Tax=Zobellia amurskyensis TaxID=248905 RepID=A0A7X2ZRW0_9FLAO|nr:FecR domain-containing protein [Zobellia amurskyensis]MUH35237.1 FecR family protein [Zobellia amurskyensis]
MKDSGFENLVVKFLTHSISSKELDNLNSALKNEDCKQMFRSQIQIDYTTRHIMSQYNKNKAKQELIRKIRKDKRTVKMLTLYKFGKYAAAVLLFFGLGYFYWNHNFYQNTSKVAIENTDQITLELSDGTVKTISEASSASVYNKKGDRVGLQQGNQIIYHKGGKAKEIVFNTVSVPYGKRFVLILSDGTKAHLNSGSSLKYPVEFMKGKKRKVYLQGEGYFDVAKDETSPFIITANKLNIQVLGTKFNLSAYPEDPNIKTVLVEGSVGFFEESTKFNEESKRLIPGHMAVWGKQRHAIKFKEVDTDLYTGWMDGKIIFSHMPFKAIVKKLERNYNVTINNSYEQLNEVRFNASFDTETISQVLEAFSKNYAMKFTVKGSRITITKP